MSCLQFFLKARDVVLSKPDNHAARMDELVFLGPGLLELSHLLEQHLSGESNITVNPPAPTLFPNNKVSKNKWQWKKNIFHTLFSSSRLLHRRTAAINFALYETSCWLSMYGPDKKSHFTFLQNTRKKGYKTGHISYDSIKYNNMGACS